jgi:putative Mn2+ efflux pump MntP
MLELIFLAVALSMDAFAVSIGLGSKPNRSTTSLALKAGLYFGFFQGAMPLIGYLAGKGAMAWVDAFAPWIAFGLLTFIGGKMIYESFAEGIEDDIVTTTHRVMLMLAIATSIDAIAAGFAINLLDVSVWISCISIGVITFGFSFLGVYIGRKSGVWLESKAELLGGVTLILIGLKLLLF